MASIVVHGATVLVTNADHSARNFMMEKRIQKTPT